MNLAAAAVGPLYDLPGLVDLAQTPASEFETVKRTHGLGFECNRAPERLDGLGRPVPLELELADPAPGAKSVRVPLERQTPKLLGVVERALEVIGLTQEVGDPGIVPLAEGALEMALNFVGATNPSKKRGPRIERFCRVETNLRKALPTSAAVSIPFHDRSEAVHDEQPTGPAREAPTLRAEQPTSPRRRTISAHVRGYPRRGWIVAAS
jgi:hypothetical protein